MQRPNNWVKLTRLPNGPDGWGTFAASDAMRLSILLIAASCCSWYCSAQPLDALPQPRLNTIFPMGAKLGSTVEVEVAGFDLDDVTGLHFTTGDLKAELVVLPEPKNDKQAKDQSKDKPKPKPTGTSARLKITVGPKSRVGLHDVRVVGKYGISNARTFEVGTLEELNETEKPNNETSEAQSLPLNGTLNGTISSNVDVDYYKFTGKSQQRLIIAAECAKLDSRCRPLLELFDSKNVRLAYNRIDRDSDAVCDVRLPSDGQYFIRVCEFAYQSGGPDHFYRLTLTTGPRLDAVLPPCVPFGTDTPVSLIGRNLPGGKPISGTDYESLAQTVRSPTGAAQDGLTFNAAPPVEGLIDGFQVHIGGSNAVPVMLSDAKFHMEAQANDTPAAAEQITVPCDVIGAIEKRYDRDWYRFEAKKGQRFAVELFADRLGSEMDTAYVIKNAKTLMNVVEEQDDEPEALHPQQFHNRGGDPPAVLFTAPLDGAYLVQVSSRESNVTYGPRCIYRLRIAVPQPDFRAVVMFKSRDVVGAPQLAPGGTTALDVFIDRRDGFTGSVTVTATGLPDGVTAAPLSIPAGTRFGTLVLSAAPAVNVGVRAIGLECSSTFHGKTLKHTARPAGLVWSFQGNNNQPAQARLEEQTVLALVAAKPAFAVKIDTAKIRAITKQPDGKELERTGDTALTLKPGDRLVLPVSNLWQATNPRENPLLIRTARTTVTVPQQPIFAIGENDQAPAATIAKDKSDSVVSLEVRANAAPGRYTVVLHGECRVQFLRDPTKKDAKSQGLAIGYATPLQVTVLPSTLAK